MYNAYRSKSAEDGGAGGGREKENIYYTLLFIKCTITNSNGREKGEKGREKRKGEKGTEKGENGRCRMEKGERYPCTPPPPHYIGDATETVVQWHTL